MDATNQIPVLIVLALIIIPIVWIMVVNKRKKQVFLNKAAKLQDQYRLEFSEKSSWDNIVLGLDEPAGKLLWFKAGKTVDEQLFIDLSKIANCRLIKDQRTVTYNNESSTATDRLALELVPKNEKEAPIFLEFYNVSGSFIFNIHLELLTKWHRLISKQLTKK